MSGEKRKESEEGLDPEASVRRQGAVKRGNVNAPPQAKKEGEEKLCFAEVNCEWNMPPDLWEAPVDTKWQLAATSNVMSPKTKRRRVR